MFKDLRLAGSTALALQTGHSYPDLFPEINETVLDKKEIITLSIREQPIKPVSFKGRYYKRIQNSNHQMAITEIADTHLKTFNSSWDFYPDSKHELDQISLQKVSRFLEMAARNDRIIADDPLTVLHKYELLKENQISNGCFLLFTNDETLSTDIEIGRFSDETTIKDSLSIRTDLFSEVELVIEFIKKHINKAYIITGKPQRDERWDYPLEAIREILINMIVRRDYMHSSGYVIKIFEDRIGFFNPGKLPEGLTIEKLLSGDYVSEIRNKQIANIFKEAGLIKKYGSGIQRILKAFSEYNLVRPEFKNTQHGFMVTVFKTPQKDTLSDKIISVIIDNPAVTQSEIAQNLNISFNTVKEYLGKLKKAGKVERTGGRRGGQWRVL